MGEWGQRTAAAHIALGNGFGFLAAAVYGCTGPNASQRTELSRTVEGVLEVFRCRGRGPGCIGGDFNTSVADLPVGELLARAGWADWSAEPTCKFANSHTCRRQDQVWLSTEMQVRLGDVQVSWSSGLKTHALQTGEFQGGDPEKFQSWTLGDSGPKEQEGSFTDEEFEAIFGGRDLWEAAAAIGDVDTLWKLLEPALCQAHAARSPGFKAPAARTVTKSEEVRRGFGGDLIDKVLTEAVRRKRWLQHWLASMGKPSCAHQLADVRRALAADPEPRWAAVALLTLPREAVEELVVQARQEEDAIREELREQRRLGYRSWCVAESEGGMKALFRWVKEGPKSLQSTGIFLKEGRLYAGQRALLEACEAAWWPLWRPGTRPNWSRVVPPKTAAGWDLLDFEAEALQRLVWTMCSTKAPGHDGWSVGRMRQWPLAVWRCIVTIFKAVELAGKWPEGLMGGIMCLLPKAGVQASTNSPLEARPVVLLPLLYRLWAYKRRREIGEWLKQHGMDGLPDSSRSAEAYGLLLAAELEQALVLDDPLLAACTDQSKAYDMVDLELLQYLMERSGLPQGITGPMMSMAKARRRIKVMNAVGGWQDPTSGMLPGCPGATFIMCFVLERWRRFTTAVGPRTWARSWVDDTTAAGKGITAALATMVASTRAMEDLEQGDGLKVNRVKSGLVVSHKVLADLVLQFQELRAQSPYGLVVGSGAEEPPEWEPQWRERLQAPETAKFTWRGSGGGEQQGTDLRTVAAVATVWLWFGEGEPPQEITEVLRANRGVWLLARLHPEEPEAAVAEALLALEPVCEPPLPQLCSASLAEARVCVRRDGDPQRWLRGPPLVLQVKAALTDLGVVQGFGAPAKDAQAKRTKVALDRLGRIARLGLPRFKLARLAGGSALTAGLFGAAAHVYDSDMLPAIRRWVLYALYKGSHFAQLQLFMHLVLPCKSADPVRVALRKGWEACELIRQHIGEEQFAAVWRGSSGDGPVRSFRLLLGTLLQPAGAELSAAFLAGAAEWRCKELAYGVLDAALERADLQWVGAHRKGLRGAEAIDVQQARALARKLPVAGAREAFESAMIGDMVVRGQTRHWQPHDGRCLCGQAVETVLHTLWECPRYVAERQGAERCGEGDVKHLPALHRQLGVPLQDPALQAWRLQQVPPATAQPPWRARVVYADASGLHPKDAAIRVVAWAVCGLEGGIWHQADGFLKIGATVCTGEAAAAACAVTGCAYGGMVITDCKAVLHMWTAIRAGRRRAQRKFLQGSCWQSLAEALAARPDVQCSWMPSHLTLEQHVARGRPAEWHAGNCRADEAAKAAARCGDIPAPLLASHRRNRAEAARVARTVAAIQLKRLKGRPRTAMGSAAKERTRRMPGLPRRLKESSGSGCQQPRPLRWSKWRRWRRPVSSSSGPRHGPRMSWCRQRSLRIHLVPKASTTSSRWARGHREAKGWSRTAGLRGCGSAAGATPVPLTRRGRSRWRGNRASMPLGRAPLRCTSCGHAEAEAQSAAAAASRSGSSMRAKSATQPARCRSSRVKGSGGLQERPASARSSGGSRAFGGGAAPGRPTWSCSLSPRPLVKSRLSCLPQPALGVGRVCTQETEDSGDLRAEEVLA